MRDLFNYAGPAGVTVLVTAAMLFAAGVILLALSRTRKAFVVYGILIWFPLLVGAMSARASMREVERSPLTYSDSISPRNLRKVRSDLQRPLSLGIAATVVLLPIAAVGLVVSRRREEKPAREG